MLQNILKIEELAALERVELNELRGRLLARRNAGDKVVGQPELSVNHVCDESGEWVRDVKVKDERIKEMNSSRRAEEG